ncbi:MAG: acylphosphatase [Krumholzibacteria bacterium]|nr:acylphosphatase [Candidatus Krumholzibacteria bacterium]
MQRLEITVWGRVQGVAFRWHTCARARQLGLVGRVRNRPDGSVRIVAEGPREALEALAAWALRGPDRARVDRRELTWGEATGTFGEFGSDG